MTKYRAISPFLCMDMTYITVLLKEGFGFKDNTVLQVSISLLVVYEDTATFLLYTNVKLEGNLKCSGELAEINTAYFCLWFMNASKIWQFNDNSNVFCLFISYSLLKR